MDNEGLVGFKICKTHHCIVIELYVLMYVNMFADNIYIIVNTSLSGKDTLSIIWT